MASYPNDWHFPQQDQQSRQRYQHQYTHSDHHAQYPLHDPYLGNQAYEPPPPQAQAYYRNSPELGYQAIGQESTPPRLRTSQCHPPPFASIRQVAESPYRGPQPDTSYRMAAARSRTHTAASSSEGSTASDTEFLSHDNHELQPDAIQHQQYARQMPPLPHGAAPRQAIPQQHGQQQADPSMTHVGGHEYGPYQHLNYAQGLQMERQFSDNAKYQSSASSHSGSSHGSDAPLQYQLYGRSSGSSGQAAPPMVLASGSAMSHDPARTPRATGMGPSPGSSAPLSGFVYMQDGPSASGSTSSLPLAAGQPKMNRGGRAPISRRPTNDSTLTLARPYYTANNASEAHFLYDTKDPERDDFMHNPGPHDDIADNRTCTLLSLRGVLNVAALVIIMLAMVGMFGAYPIITQIQQLRPGNQGAWNLGGTNSSGQVPSIPGLRTLVDRDTPDEALTRTGFDGKTYNLVFSDEFEVDGRSFFEGDDPYFTAIDAHYWGTGDRQWYDPDSVTTRGGSMVITITEEQIHNLDYKSAMVQSWNQLCFTGGYIEVRVSLPGSSTVGGFWPGAWTMGNLARAGYGATTSGVWPYSYDTCDVGTRPNQTNADGSPANAAGLSYQPGQKLSACTCKGEDHPGPRNTVGRGGPEIDLLEAAIHVRNGRKGGEVSQSLQMAPYDHQYHWGQEVSTIHDSSKTWFNEYEGGVYQEALSGLTFIDDADYQLPVEGFGTYGYEYKPGTDDDSYVTWTYNGKPTWTMPAAAIGPDADVGISQRVISEEPMYIILNLGLSDSFQTIEFDSLVFPAQMKIDYVRVYQREGETNVGCDPDSHPTAKYIQDHLEAYSNPNLTTWEDAGHTFPKNRLIDDC